MKEFKCVVCDKKSEESELQNHFLIHDLSEIPRFSCHLCSISFLRFSTLENHLRRVHLKQNVSRCLENSHELQELRREAQRYQQKSLVLDVASSLGDNEDEDEEEYQQTEDDTSPQSEKASKTYTCKVEGCSKTFKHLTSFIMHGKCIHSDERPFTCDICSKSFKTSSNLNVHIKMHKNQRDHQCTRCPQSFFTSSHLKAHLKIHLKEAIYKCVECGKSFIHLSSYKKHQNFHQGIKSHQCTICNRNFAQQCHLRAHIRIHTNEKSHICDKCSKAFRRADTLRVHQKTHES